MDRAERIFNNPTYKSYMAANADREQDRIFCKHNMAHVMDVARIAYILNLEEGYGISKELVYSTALLHDIGRHIQYDTGEKHAPAGAILAQEILEECAYTREEQALISEAIACHSDKSLMEEKSLRGLIARADVLSRACYDCRACKACNWDHQRQNHSFSGV